MDIQSPQEKQAYGSGYMARINGSAENPYKRLSGLYYAWLKGWKQAYHDYVCSIMGTKPIANDN